jgi:small conductance mechanosensitive channel
VAPLSSHGPGHGRFLGPLIPTLALVALLSAAAAAVVHDVPWVGGTTALRVLVALAYLGVGAVALQRGRRSAIAVVHEADDPSRIGVRNLLVHLTVALGYLVLVVVAADVLRLSLSGLAFGGAVTGVVLGLAAQSTLGNLFAGVVLLVLRPYVPGQWVALRSWYSSGIEYQGLVVEVNLFYTILDDGAQRRVIPNAAAAVSYVTLAGDGRRRSFQATLPRDVSPRRVAALLEERAGPGVATKVVALAADAYTLAVVLPEGRPGVWEEVLAAVVEGLSPEATPPGPS